MSDERLSDERLEQIKARFGAVPDAPWKWIDEDMLCGMSPDGEAVDDTVLDARHIAAPEMEFFEHSKADIAALLAEVHQLRALTTITNEMIERAAAALYRFDTGCSWNEDANSGERNDYRESVRLVLESILGDVGDASA